MYHPTSAQHGIPSKRLEKRLVMMHSEKRGELEYLFVLPTHEIQIMSLLLAHSMPLQQ